MKGPPSCGFCMCRLLEYASTFSSFTDMFRPKLAFSQPHILVVVREVGIPIHQVTSCCGRNLKGWVVARFFFSTSQGHVASLSLSSMDYKVFSFNTADKSSDMRHSTHIENQLPKNRLEIYLTPKGAKRNSWVSLVIQKAFEQMLQGHHDKRHLPPHRKSVQTRVN